MATTTYTSRLRLSRPTTGELFGLWGNEVNQAITDLVDAAVAGIVTVVHDNTANYTLTALNGASDEARNAVLHVTGALTAARNVVCPTNPKLYVFDNATTGGFAVTLKTTAGTGVSVPNGAMALLRSDGVNVVPWIPTTGTGSAVLATSPTLVTPDLGTPSAGVMTNASGTAVNLVAGTANALKSATGVVSFAAAAAPLVGQIPVATSPTTATWQTVPVVPPVALPPSASIAVNAALVGSGGTFTLTPNQAFTLQNPTNPVNGMTINFVFTAGATPFVMTLGSAYSGPGGGANLALTAAANAVDFMCCYYNGPTAKWICVRSQNFLP